MSLFERLTKQFPNFNFRQHAPIGSQSWFQCGGNAEILFQPKSLKELQYFLQNRPVDIPLFYLGAGSNTLIRDGGVPGITIRLRRGFNEISVENTTLNVGAGALDYNVATVSAEHGITGLEFLIGIPGSIGGNLRMNAGCYGREIQDILVHCTALSPNGTLHTITLEDMGFKYRHCAIPADWIFVSAVLKGKTGNVATSQQKIAAIQKNRTENQPTGGRTGGSTFRNPAGHKAWQLIDQAGYRGKVLGGAKFSEKHCNFLINTGAATAHDIESLGDAAKDAVKQQSGVDLHWEIARIGNYS